MPDLSVRLKLAAVWTALMFLFVYADLLSFFRPGELAEISAGNMGPFDVSQGSLLIAAVVVTIPALMIVVSAAAPFLVASTLLSGSELTIHDIGLNPRRTGLLDVLERMGAKITVFNRRRIGGECPVHRAARRRDPLGDPAVAPASPSPLQRQSAQTSHTAWCWSG